jgi:hypothetical protein
MYFYCYDHIFSLYVCLAITTEVFPCFFLTCKANARVKTRKDGARPTLFLILVLFYVFLGLFYVFLVLCRSLYCLCVYVYCTTATGWLHNCS